MPLNYVTLVLDLYDGQGNPEVRGQAALVPGAVLTDPGAGITTQDPVTAVFGAAGFPQVRLLATDNGGPQPAGWTWGISFSGQRAPLASFSFFLPYSGGATQYLSALVQVPAVAPSAQYLPLPAGMPQAGQVPVASGTGEGSAWSTLETPAWTPADQGLLTWNIDPGTEGQALALPGAGVATVMTLKLAAAAPVTSIHMYAGVAGGGLTAGECFAALYQGGALLGVTGDQSAAWAVSGEKVMALAGGPVQAAAGLVQVIAWYNGTTSPKFAAGDSGPGKANLGLPLASSRWGIANTGLTTTAPATLGAITAQASAYVCALS